MSITTLHKPMIVDVKLNDGSLDGLVNGAIKVTKLGAVFVEETGLYRLIFAAEEERKEERREKRRVKRKTEVVSEKDKAERAALIEKNRVI